ncbi:MAG: hypothetical protein U1F35_05415 [Steroidobacteraceae bacterium]
MSTQTTFLTAGATSKTVDIALVQKASASSPGDPITGLAYNTASFKAYQRSGPTSTPAAITLATQTVGGAYSSGGFVELDATNMPGLYRFDIPNALIASAGETNILFSGAANLAPHTLKIIVTDVDFYDRAANFKKVVSGTQAAVGSLPTIEQALYLAAQALTYFQYTGTSFLVKDPSGTVIRTVTLDSSSNPASGAVTG